LGIGFAIIMFINFFLSMILENMKIELEFFGINLSGILKSMIETLFIIMAFFIGKSSGGSGGT
ncbi:unnamed protein product, partial [marine sediment metagenome]